MMFIKKKVRIKIKTCPVPPHKMSQRKRRNTGQKCLLKALFCSHGSQSHSGCMVNVRGIGRCGRTNVANLFSTLGQLGLLERKSMERFGARSFGKRGTFSKQKRLDLFGSAAFFLHTKRRVFFMLWCLSKFIPTSGRLKNKSDYGGNQT